MYKKKKKLKQRKTNPKQTYENKKIKAKQYILRKPTKREKKERKKR
jgi:hypothetical protein